MWRVASSERTSGIEGGGLHQKPAGYWQGKVDKCKLNLVGNPTIRISPITVKTEQWMDSSANLLPGCSPAHWPRRVGSAVCLPGSCLPITVQPSGISIFMAPILTCCLSCSSKRIRVLLILSVGSPSLTSGCRNYLHIYFFLGPN